MMSYLNNELGVQTELASVVEDACLQMLINELGNVVASNNKRNEKYALTESRRTHL